jgi:DNA-binding transcriptional ArsR family regulator
LTKVDDGPIFNYMVELQSTRLDAVFHALGDATRRRMLRELAQGERSVGQLAEPFEMSLAAASKHVKALEGAGLIRREVQGRTHICRLEAGPLAEADDWLRFYERFWTTRLDKLEQLLRGGSVPNTPSTSPTSPTPTPTPTHKPKPKGRP